MSVAVSSIQNLCELLKTRAEAKPNEVAYRFLGTEGDEQVITRAEFETRARAIGHLLLAQPSKRGERVVLLHEQSLEDLAAFFGCLYAGKIAVPLYPPRGARSLPRFESILQDCGAEIALTTVAALERTERALRERPGLKNLAILASDAASPSDEFGLDQDQTSRDEIAFLQYTSGSTAQPKGVMITHGNLLHNLEYSRVTIEAGPESTFLSWLPLFHDMGLIGMGLLPLFADCPGIFMSPSSFLQRPLRWLKAVSDYHATVSGGPNFAYELCYKAIAAEEREGLDLSQWKTAFNGSEPIRADVMDRFCEFFAPCGFQAKSFFPCYGLAEATLMVSGSSGGGAAIAPSFSRGDLAEGRVVRAESRSRESCRIVRCGRPGLGNAVTIVDPATGERTAPGRIGEIWVSGPSVGLGYWGRLAETDETFRAFDTTGEGPFLRTGDLGFIDDGDLFVTGRSKDLIIIRGRNHYPQDIESTVENAHRSLRRSSCAAFSIETDGEEQLVVVQEINFREKPDLDAVIDSIRREVTGAHELQPHALILVRPGSIPKTSSGKIQRRACRQAYLEGSLDVLKSWQSAGSAEGRSEDADLSSLFLKSESERGRILQSYIVSLAGGMAGMEPNTISPESTLNSLGLDSMMQTRFCHALEKAMRRDLPGAPWRGDISLAAISESLLSQLNGRGHMEALPSPAPRQTPRAESLASPSERALWFTHQMDPRGSAYNVFVAMKITSPLEKSILHKSLQALVDRHAALRTCYDYQSGELKRSVADRAQMCFEEIDASSWRENDRIRHLEKSAHAPFDLQRGPLFRAVLYNCAPHEPILLLVTHHIAVDGWSMAVLLDELGEVFSSRCRNTAAQLPRVEGLRELYDTEQSELLRGRQSDDLWAYWENHLKGDLVVLDLPSSRTRSSAQAAEGGVCGFELNKELTRHIKAFAQSEGITSYGFLLAAFKVLLHRLTGQNDLIVGTPSACRNSSCFENLVGYFVNMLPIRSRPHGDTPFRSFLREVASSISGAREHEALPFSFMVERLQPSRDANRSLIFQAAFAMQQPPRRREEGMGAFMLGRESARLRLGDLDVESVPIEHGAARFDVELQMAESDGRLLGDLHYRRDLFDEKMAERVCRYFKTLLNQIVSHPDETLARLPMLTGEEIRRTRVEWNDTGWEVASDTRLDDLFQKQNRLHPEHPAVIQGAVSLTYEELNRRSDLIADRLRDIGADPSNLVAVLMEKGWNEIAAVLGILKSGAAYLPLSSDAPSEHLSRLIEEGGASIVLTERKLVENVQCPESVRVLFIEDEARTTPKRNRIPPSDASDLAYVIYTSGSTGRPKGVMIEHRSAANTILDVNDRFSINSEDRILALSHLNFDLSVYDIFGMLAAGGTIVIPKASQLKEPEALLSLMKKHSVTVWNSVPAQMEMIVSYAESRSRMLPESLRLVLLSGDWIPVNLPSRLRRLCPHVQIVSLGGATEASIWSILYPIGEVQADWRSIPYGRPMRNQRFYVLNEALEPCPILVKGELYIGGVGLARGYLRDEERTAASFILHPRTGERLYRTGDLGRYLDDGNIEFLGRADNQVKIRGFRIELGEIESNLVRHPSVRECVVVARGKTAEEKRLVAYVAPKEGNKLDEAELRNFLKGKLPGYMVPSVFVVLQELPKSANGKIDRKCMPPVASADSRREERFVEPREGREKELASIWAEALKTSRVGTRDNFFELGGNSLLAVQVIEMIRKRFGKELPVSAIFRAPTVAELGEMLAEKTSRGSDRVVCLRHGDEERPLFLIHPAGGQVICYMDLADHLMTHRAIFGIESRGVINPEDEHASIEEMAAEYAGLIRERQPRGLYSLAGWSMGGVVAYAVAERLEASGESVEFLALLDSYLSNPSEDFENHTLWDLAPALGEPFLSAIINLEDAERHRLEEEIAGMEIGEALGRLLAWGKARGILNGAPSPESLLPSASLLRRHRSMLDEYSPRGSIKASIRLWQARERIHDVVASDWRELTLGTVHQHDADGHHFNMIRHPHVLSLADSLGRSLPVSDEKPQRSSSSNSVSSGIL